MKRYLTHTDAPEQARVPPEAVIVVVTVVQPVPKGPWVPEAVLDRRGPSVSYTHLDVYKRQIPDSPDRWGPLGRQDRQGRMGLTEPWDPLGRPGQQEPQGPTA